MQSDQWTEGSYYNITCRVPDWQAFCIRPHARILFSPKLNLLLTAEGGRDVLCGSCFRSRTGCVGAGSLLGLFFGLVEERPHTRVPRRNLPRVASLVAQ